MLRLSDIEWGDVISDKDGVLVVRGLAPIGTMKLPCVVKRYACLEHQREIAAYALLTQLGVPTLEVLGSGEDWIALIEVQSAGYRIATKDDLADQDVARLIARWYAKLHTASQHWVSAGEEIVAGITPTDLPRESAVLTLQALAEVGELWPELRAPLAALAPAIQRWREAADAAGKVVTHNDFFWGNLALADDASQAIIFDYNLLGCDYRYADVRNVESQLTDHARAAFRAEYEKLAGVVDPAEVEFDEPVGHLVCLYFAAERCRQLESTDLPAWAEDSRAWVLAQV